MSAVELEETFVVEGVAPQQCFDYLADVENAGAWNTFVSSATAEGEGLGRVVHARIQFLVPLPFEVRAEVTTWEEPHRYALTSRVPFTADLGARFVEVPEGTRMTYFLHMHPTKFFPVPKIVLRKALKGQFERDGKLLQQRLQELADRP